MRSFIVEFQSEYQNESKELYVFKSYLNMQKMWLADYKTDWGSF